MSASRSGPGRRTRGGGAGRARRRPPELPDPLLAAALRAQSDGVLIARCDGRRQLPLVLFVNDGLRAMVGPLADELVGRRLEHLHANPADLARLSDWLAAAPPRPALTGDGFLRRRDGTTFNAAWSFDALPPARGRPTHLVATYRDQTERRRLQETLVHAQRLDAVGRLAGGVAHDFNNLISVINGYCEILAAHVASHPQAMREVTEIHHAGRKAAALIQQLLAFSRRQPFDGRVINLNPLIEENAAILRRLVGTAGEIEFQLAPDLPNVRTDPAQFQQVLLNLVLNARDALRDAGRIVVSTACRELPANHHRRATDLRPGRYVVLSVADNGTGMDAETQRHLFEPFFTTKPEGKGTGLGLALVYGVVQQSAGDIAVRSALLVGSTFEIFLPATREPVAEPPPAVTPLPTTRGHESVALVEDDDVVRKMVAGILTADGYRVTAASSYAELVAAPDTPPQVQLLIGPCVAEGGKPARHLLRQNPGLRFLLIRPNPQAGSHSPLVPVARQASLAKPYALSELVRAARRLLDSPA
ncbi:MAG: PAS domain S-box protein [Verrucomicrobia bacterium]|nr:PAS domain S-box protein [Verrucomicrobiota bacterium]